MNNESETFNPPRLIPNPGSDDAISLGCTCPVLDNGRGSGYMGESGVFVYTMGCPIHSIEVNNEVQT